jgi:hypothetical protein
LVCQYPARGKQPLVEVQIFPQIGITPVDANGMMVYLNNANAHAIPSSVSCCSHQPGDSPIIGHSAWRQAAQLSEAIVVRNEAIVL